jgi:hypothetical protein
MPLNLPPPAMTVSVKLHEKADQRAAAAHQVPLASLAADVRRVRPRGFVQAHGATLPAHASTARRCGSLAGGDLAAGWVRGHSWHEAGGGFHARRIADALTGAAVYGQGRPSEGLPAGNRASQVSAG